MGFISFNEKYFNEKLTYYENKVLSDADNYEAKQLLKLLDDTLDEGYTDLENKLSEYHIRERLNKIVDDPFKLIKLDVPNLVYDSREYELDELCDLLIKDVSTTQDNPILDKLIAYVKSIEYKDDTGYIFLFRDGFLPYIYFKNKGYINIYPMLISRNSLYDLSGNDDIDSDIRYYIFEALEKGLRDRELFDYCKKSIKDEVIKYPRLHRTLIELLGDIKLDKIMVIESGYCGTIPMLLMAMDERVDFKMYTTAPYLFDNYKDKIYCTNYEDLRLFETLYAQEYLMKYVRYGNKKFYVKITDDKHIRNKAISEISKMM